MFVDKYTADVLGGNGEAVGTTGRLCWQHARRCIVAGYGLSILNSDKIGLRGSISRAI
jgi:hypothetical protein